MAGNALITDINNSFIIEASSEDLAKARLILYALEEMGYAGVLTTSEHSALVQSLVPQAFERGHLHHLAATNVGGLISRIFKKAL